MNNQNLSQNNILDSIDPDKKVYVALSENYAEITVLERDTQPFNSMRISRIQYVNKNTGEIMSYKLNDDNKKSDESLRKCFKRFTCIAKFNFTGKHPGVFLTLGYDYTMSDTKQLNHDYNLFWRKLKRKYPDLEYLGIIEYKENKDLHFHVLIKSSNDKLYLERNQLVTLWGQNAVYIKRIKPYSVETLINYMNPFIKQKKYARTRFYERNAQIYRKSKGILMPKKLVMSLRSAIEIMDDNSYEPYDQISYDIKRTIADEEVTLNSVTKISYKKEK